MEAHSITSIVIGGLSTSWLPNNDGKVNTTIVWKELIAGYLVTEMLPVDAPIATDVTPEGIVVLLNAYANVEQSVEP